MGEDSPVPVFTGAELALADALILLMKVMAMHGIIKPEAIDVVFSDLEAPLPRATAQFGGRDGGVPAPSCERLPTRT